MNECFKIGEIEDRVRNLENKMSAVEAQIGDRANGALSRRAAAIYLGIDPKTLKSHTDMGLVNAIPGTTKYTKAELDRYRERRRRG